MQLINFIGNGQRPINNGHNMNNETVTRTFTVTASEDVMKRFEKFLCFLHFNGGHSGTFAMPFDGDGSDKFEVYPPPHKGNKDWSRIASAGCDVEIAKNDRCESRPLNWDKPYYFVKGKELYRTTHDGHGRDGRHELRKTFDN